MPSRSPEGTLRRGATLLAGSAGGQALALAASPLLARCYGPDAFAALGLFVAATAFAGPLVVAGLDAAIVLDRDDPDASRAAFGAALLFTVLGAAVVGIVAALAGCGGARAAALAVGTALGGALPVLAARALAAGRTRAVAFGRLARASGVAAIQLVLALVLGGGGNALVAGLLGGQFVACLALAAGLRGTGAPRFDRAALRAALLRHRRLLRWSAPQTGLNNIGNALLPMLLGALAGPTELGEWTLANRVVGVPAATLGEAARQSLLVAATGARGDDAALARLVRRGFGTLVLPLALAACVAALLGPAVFAHAFGPRWRPAGTMAAIAFAAEAAGLANIPAVAAITARRAQRALFRVQVVAVPARLAAFAGTLALAGPVPALAAAAACGVVTSVGVTAGVLRRLAGSFSRPFVAVPA